MFFNGDGTAQYTFTLTKTPTHARHAVASATAGALVPVDAIAVNTDRSATVVFRRNLNQGESTGICVMYLAHSD